MLLFAFKVAPNQWQVLLVHLVKKSLRTVKWYLDSSLPCQKATVGSFASHIADVLLLREDVAAKHETPNLGPCLLEFNWESIYAAGLAHVDQLGQAILVLGIGGDASRDLDSRARRVRQVGKGKHVIKDAVIQPLAFFMDTITKGDVAGISIFNIFVAQLFCPFIVIAALLDDRAFNAGNPSRSHLLPQTFSLFVGQCCQRDAFTLPNIPKPASFCMRFSKIRVLLFGRLRASPRSSTGNG